MIITLQQFLKERKNCYVCGGKIYVEYRSGNETYFLCTKTLGHYHASITRLTIAWDGPQRIDREAVQLKHFHYIDINYETSKAGIVNHESELVNITVNISEQHRIDGLLVSRDGLEKLAHKAAVVRHFR